MCQLIKVQVANIEDGDADDEFVNLPAKWTICGTCHGNGAHSLHLGAITSEDRRLNWDEDSFNDYMSGAYDRKCDDCDGTGKVLQIDRRAMMTEAQKAALKKYDDDAEIDRQLAAEEAAERRYFYGPDAY